jgi:hypothetical protein
MMVKRVRMGHRIPISEFMVLMGLMVL